MKFQLDSGESIRIRKFPSARPVDLRFVYWEWSESSNGVQLRSILGQEILCFETLFSELRLQILYVTHEVKQSSFRRIEFSPEVS